MEANKMVSGKTSGMSFGKKYNKNLKMTEISRSLPANSLIYSQMVCNANISMRMENTLIKVLRYVVSM